MKNAYVFLADGFEEMEAVAPIDILRRAGVAVTVVALKGKSAVSSHSLGLVCDANLDDVASGALPDLVVLPGGGQGSKALASSPVLERLVRRMFAEDRLVGAICAAPAVALGRWGLLSGRRFTAYPGSAEGLAVTPLSDRVVEDGNLITAGGAGIAEEFALALVRRLVGIEVEKKIALGILARGAS